MDEDEVLVNAYGYAVRGLPSNRQSNFNGDAEMTEEMNSKPGTVPSRTTGNKKSVRDIVLRGLFALALAWTLLWFGLGEMTVSLNPIPEGSGLHTAVEHWAPPLVALITAGILLSLFVKFKPGFLSVPKEVTSLRLWSTLLATAVIIGIILPLIVLAATIILVPPRPHPENPQYIPFIFWVMPFVVLPLTPVASILFAWMWIVFRNPATD